MLRLSAAVAVMSFSFNLFAMEVPNAGTVEAEDFFCVLRLKGVSEKEAAALRQVDQESGFIFMSELEHHIKTYETNRTQYKTIDDFLPQLIAQFATFDRSTVNAKLLNQD